MRYPLRFAVGWIVALKVALFESDIVHRQKHNQNHVANRKSANGNRSPRNEGG